MLIDAAVDHGPILDQEFHELSGKETAPQLAETLFTRGGELLVEVIPAWLSGEIEPQEQEHEGAVYTKKIAKTDGEISLTDDPQTLWRKFRAYQPWPGIFFFDGDKRIKITDAVFKGEAFIPTKVVPEGKNVMSYETFMRK
jgi:methionyl-tRNA formyltransferase